MRLLRHPRTWFAVLAIGALATLATLSTSCGRADANGRALRIAMAPWPGFDVALYGQVKGHFERRGVTVEFIRLEHQSDAVRAVRRGRVDAAFATISDLVALPRDDVPMTVLLVTNVSDGSDGIVVQSHIDELEDLRGKRVAAKVGSVNQLILFEALDWRGIPTQSVDLLDVTNEVGYREFLAGNVDGAVLWEPQLSEAAGRSGGKVLFRTSDLESSVIDCLIARKEVVSKNQARFDAFVAGWFDVMHDVETRPGHVYRTVASQLGQNAESFTRDYAGLRRGDLELNRRLIQDRRLELRLPKIISLLGRETSAAPKISIESELMERAVTNWRPPK